MPSVNVILPFTGPGQTTAMSTTDGNANHLIAFTYTRSDCTMATAMTPPQKVCNTWYVQERQTITMKATAKGTGLTGYYDWETPSVTSDTWWISSSPNGAWTSIGGPNYDYRPPTVCPPGYSVGSTWSVTTQTPEQCPAGFTGTYTQTTTTPYICQANGLATTNGSSTITDDQGTQCLPVCPSTLVLNSTSCGGTSPPLLDIGPPGAACTSPGQSYAHYVGTCGSGGYEFDLMTCQQSCVPPTCGAPVADTWTGSMRRGQPGSNQTTSMSGFSSVVSEFMDGDSIRSVVAFTLNTQAVGHVKITAVYSQTSMLGANGQPFSDGVTPKVIEFDLPQGGSVYGGTAADNAFYIPNRMGDHFSMTNGQVFMPGYDASPNLVSLKAEYHTCGMYNGTCGSDSGGTFSSLSSTDANLCGDSDSTVQNFSPTGSGWSWSCSGIDGGSASPVCTANSGSNPGSSTVDYCDYGVTGNTHPLSGAWPYGMDAVTLPATCDDGDFILLSGGYGGSSARYAICGNSAVNPGGAPNTWFLAGRSCGGAGCGLYAVGTLIHLPSCSNTTAPKITLTASAGTNPTAPKAASAPLTLSYSVTGIPSSSSCVNSASGLVNTYMVQSSATCNNTSYYSSDGWSQILPLVPLPCNPAPPTLNYSNFGNPGSMTYNFSSSNLASFSKGKFTMTCTDGNGHISSATAIVYNQ